MLKTKLPEAISTVKEAKLFLSELYNNNESFHPEDDANDIVWQTTEPNEDERKQLNKLMDDIYNLEGNNGKHDASILFCPCEYLLSLDPDYMKMMQEDETDYFKQCIKNKQQFKGFNLVNYKSKIASSIQKEIDSTHIFKNGKFVSSTDATKETNSLDRAKEKIIKVLLA